MNLAVGRPPAQPGEFYFTTKAIVPEGGGGERRRFRTIASSTVKDMQGDEMKLSALEDMAAAFRAGIGIFMNHKYDAPHAGFGMSDSAEVKATGLIDTKTGSPIYDLHIAGFVDESNPIAVQLHDSMLGGMRWGTSVGAIVTKHKKNDAGRYDIEHVNLKEASIVGVPMNQRSYVQKGDGSIVEAEVQKGKSWIVKAASAAAALDDAVLAPSLDDDDDEEPTVQAGVATTTNTTGTVVTNGNVTTWDLTNPNVTTTPAIVAGLDTSEGAALQRQGLDPKGDKCENCGHGSGCDCSTCDCSSDYHSNKSVTDLGPDAKVAGDEHTHDTSADGQEAEEATPEPEGAPEAEGATPETASEEAVESDKGYDEQDVIALAQHARDLAVALTERDTEITTLKAENDRLTSEVNQANEAILKMLRQPLRRQAVGHVVELDKALPSFLAPEVKDFLTKSAGESREP